MNDDFFRGSKNGLYFFFIGAFITVVTGKFLSPFEFPVRAAAGTLLLILYMIMVFTQSRVKSRSYQILQICSFSVIAVMLGLNFSDAALFFCTMGLQSVVMLMYMDAEITKLQSYFSAVFMTAAGIAGHFLFPQLVDPVKFPICAITVMGAQWTCYNVAKFIEQRKARNREQERSLDDLLRVIENKCDEARDAAKSKSDFLSNMSHEIRTPLNSVLGMNELILRESKDENILKYAANVESSGTLLLSLINDILDFSKLESGRMEIMPVSYHIASIVNDTVNMLSRKLEQKGLELKINTDPNIPGCLMGDEVRIRQILTNIMSNAVKYTDRGTVTLTAGFEKLSGDNVTLILSVKDTGRGIKEEDQSKLFDGFTRMDQIKNRNIEGTGLGLSITAKLVSMMNGSISVKSIYGVGSEFTVRLPQQVISAEPSGDFCAAPRSEDRHSYRESFTAPEAHILITDDNKSNLMVAEGLLKPTKIKVDCASSGAECIARLRSEKYNVIFLDHMMPETDGVETLRLIRADGLAIGTPIVALTANAVSGARDMYLDYGFEDYLAKPIVGKSLEKMLLKLLPRELVHLTEEETDEKVPPAESTASLIDRELGMSYCGNMEELYVMILHTYCDEYDERIIKLREYYEQGDIQNYRILVHSLKSNSLNIGAKALSEEALKHETAAKGNDIKTISDGIEQLAEHYSEVVTEVKAMLSEYDAAADTGEEQ